MEEWQRHVIRVNLPQLLEDTKCEDAFLSRLLATGILCNSDVQSIKSSSDSYSRNSSFYHLITSRTLAYDAVIKALKDTSQSGPAAILENARMLFSPPSEPPTPKVVTPTSPVGNVQQASGDVREGPGVPIAMSKPQQDGNAGSRPGVDQIDFMDNVNPLTIQVIKPRDGPMRFADDEYLLPHDFKGFALILNITEFENSLRNRNGAKLDTQYMTQLWSQLGYEVTTHEGFFTFMDVDKILEEFKSQFRFFPPSSNISCVIFIGSHGSFSKIDSSDHQEINLYKHVIYKFDASNCRQLEGKPKIFVIQACQRFQTDSVPDRTEADTMLETPIDDAIVCFSTIPGYVANRDVFLGTWYTYCLSKVFMEEAHRMDLLKMLKKTQETMRNIRAAAPQGQLATYMDLGIKTLYFNMRP